MLVLVVSDIHYETSSHHGVDESGAFDWLLKKIMRLNPDCLIGLGDWGHAWVKPQWDELAGLCNIAIIYGNHDKMELLRRVANSDGTKALAQDGGVKVIDGLRVGFINGIISDAHRVKDGVPRKTEEEYLRIGLSLPPIDILCTHESPYVEEYGTRIRPSVGTETLGRIIRHAKPRLALSGHLGGPYTIGKVGDTLSFRVDSSPSEKHFAIFDTSSHLIRVYHDWEVVRELHPTF